MYRTSTIITAITAATATTRHDVKKYNKRARANRIGMMPLDGTIDWLSGVDIRYYPFPDYEDILYWEPKEVLSKLRHEYTNYNHLMRCAIRRSGTSSNYDGLRDRVNEGVKDRLGIMAAMGNYDEPIFYQCSEEEADGSYYSYYLEEG